MQFTVEDFLTATDLPKQIDTLTLKHKLNYDEEELDLTNIVENDFIEIVKRCIVHNVSKLIFIKYKFYCVFDTELSDDYYVTNPLDTVLLKNFKIRTLEFYKCDNVIRFIRFLNDSRVWDKSLTFLTVKNINPSEDNVEKEMALWLQRNHRLLEVEYIPRMTANGYLVQCFNKTINKFLKRNKTNHEACSRGCISLLMIWKFRRAECGLNLIDKNIVIKIIQILWSDFYLKPQNLDIIN